MNVLCFFKEEQDNSFVPFLNIIESIKPSDSTDKRNESQQHFYQKTKSHKFVEEIGGIISVAHEVMFFG
ncbi:hypothetical protein TNCT_658891 [Trichonephila clavata]|uniref:Uncharacterized protein n=1 Tax=Trichonephila clavata TaxID=2740835 RepID=A0A8X6KHD3_TRICU|nr:hypothetical protein TNCT_658891 [Trichonephila clavata]